MIPALALLLSSTTAVDVDYMIRVDAENEVAAVTLVASNLDPDRRRLPLSMAEGFAYVRLAEPLVLTAVTASTETAPLEVERPEPYRWEVVTGGATSVTVRYRVGLTHRTLPAVANDEFEFPYVELDHGLLVTGALLLRPHELATRARRVRFELPASWEVLAPWPDHAEGGFAPTSDAALANDLIAVGTWATRSIVVDDFEAVIAVAPRQPGLLDGVAEPLAEIVRAELEIFERPPAGRYLFLFGRSDLEHGFGGSPKTSSMTLSIDASLRSEADRHVEHLVAHEFFHTWAAARVPLPDELRWVNEGITDYFAHVVPLRLGRMPLAGCHARFGEKLTALGRAGRADRTLEEAGGPAFFEGGSAHQRVYAEGLVLGAWIDAAIRQHDGARRLDDLMRAFLNDERWNDPDERPTADDFLALVADLAGSRAAERVRSVTRERGGVDWVELFAEVGVELRRSTRPPQLSLRANLEGRTIAGIDPSGLGFALGLRDGDRLIEINGQSIELPNDVYAAWAAPVDGRMRFVVERAGAEHSFDEPLRDEVLYEVVRGFWELDAPGTRR